MLWVPYIWLMVGVLHILNLGIWLTMEDGLTVPNQLQQSMWVRALIYNLHVQGFKEWPVCEMFWFKFSSFQILARRSVCDILVSEIFGVLIGKKPWSLGKSRYFCLWKFGRYVGCSLSSRVLGYSLMREHPNFWCQGCM